MTIDKTLLKALQSGLIYIAKYALAFIVQLLVIAFLMDALKVRSGLGVITSVFLIGAGFGVISLINRSRKEAKRDEAAKEKARKADTADAEEEKALAVRRLTEGAPPEAAQES